MGKKIQYAGKMAERYSSADRTEHPHNSSCYLTWLEELGNLRDKRVLDLACGNGHSARKLALSGAHVHGVDISLKMITLAEAKKAEHPSLDITYEVADALTLNLGREFDIVTPSFLFNYAEDEAEIEHLARTVTLHLRSGGKMVALNAPPQPIVPRMEHGGHHSEWINEPWKEGSRVLLRNYDLNGNTVCDIIFRYWSQETYERCLRNAGLSDFRWVRIKLEKSGHMFLNWPELEHNMCSIVLTATKR